MDIRNKMPGFHKGTRNLDNGDSIEEHFWPSGQGGERYYFDFMEGFLGGGWQQYDTDQDAWYFGVWVNIERREILTYAEGDITLRACASVESLKAQLESMAKFYGDPPPAFTSIDTNTGQVTHYIDERPGVDGREVE